MSILPLNNQNNPAGNPQRGDEPNITARANPKKNGTNGSRASKTATKQVLQDKNHELNNTVDQLAAQLKKAQEALAEAEKAKQNAEKAKAEAETRAQTAMGAANGGGGQVEPAASSIPKPSDRELNRKGEFNRLRKAMGLEGNKEEYTRIQATVRDLCPRLGVDYSLHLAQQSASTLAKLFKIARNRHPYLARFQNDWATAQLVKQFLQNKRKQENRKRKEAESGDAATSRKRGRFDIDADSESDDGLNDGDEDHVGGPETTTSTS